MYRRHRLIGAPTRFPRRVLVKWSTDSGASLLAGSVVAWPATRSLWWSAQSGGSTRALTIAVETVTPQEQLPKARVSITNRGAICRICE